MAKSEKKGQTKNQHYVPQFYQRYFSIDSKTIGVYVINSDKNIFSAPIKNQSSGDYFYSENMKIEHALGKIEELSKRVIDKINSNPKGHLTQEEESILYTFTMLQNGRTLAQANLIQEYTNTTLRNLVKKQIELFRNNDKKSEVEEITDEMLDKCSFNLTEPGMFALGTQTQLIETCLDLEYKILINNAKIPFITSDNPVALYDQFMERMDNQIYALGSRGLQMYLPLTPTLGVMYYDPKCYKLGYRKKAYVEITQNKDICELNKLTAANAENILYYKQNSITEYKLREFATQGKKNKPSTRIEMLPELQSPQGTIVGSHNVSMFCKLKLSFIKELPNYKAIQPQDFDPTQHRFRNIAY